MDIIEDTSNRTQIGFPVFVYRSGETPPPVIATPTDTLRSVLAQAGISDTSDLVAFFPKDAHGNELDDIDDPEHDDAALNASLEALGIGRGARIVVSLCRWVEVVINYQDESVRHRFRPSDRVGKVLRWSRRHWHLEGEDFETIKLRLCEHGEDLSDSTRLVQLLSDETCGLCVELVPVPKVNG